jgi:uncharacterized protein (DUF1810 family)
VETRDPFDLDRFVKAQAEIFETAMAELTAGRKRSHWMWFVFPQLRGLGRSITAHHFGIASAEEAKAYLDHPLLGPRLERATGAVLALSGRSLSEIFGSPDDLKFRSSMTLFDQMARRPSCFAEALARYCDGRGDEETLRLLDKAGSG